MYVYNLFYACISLNVTVQHVAGPVKSGAGYGYANSMGRHVYLEEENITNIPRTTVAWLGINIYDAAKIEYMF